VEGEVGLEEVDCCVQFHHLDLELKIDDLLLDQLNQLDRFDWLGSNLNFLQID
jgi:hypothetical protein